MALNHQALMLAKWQADELEVQSGSAKQPNDKTITYAIYIPWR